MLLHWCIQNSIYNIDNWIKCVPDITQFLFNSYKSGLSLIISAIEIPQSCRSLAVVAGMKKTYDHAEKTFGER